MMICCVRLYIFIDNLTINDTISLIINITYYHEFINSDLLLVIL